MFRPFRPTFSQSRSGGTSSPATASAERPPLGGTESIPPGRPRPRGAGSRPGKAPGPQETSTFAEATSPDPNAERAREAPAAESALPDPSLAPRHPSGNPPTRARPRGTPPPPPPGALPLRADRTDPTPSRATSPHPPAPAPPAPRHGLPPAGRRPVPVSLGPAGSWPRSPCIPPQRAIARGRPRRRKAALSGAPSPRGPHRVSKPRAGVHTPQPGPAASTASPGDASLPQPGTRRDGRARIPTPGLFLGARPRPDRNSFLPRAHAHFQGDRGVPPPASTSPSSPLHVRLASLMSFP